MAKAAEAFRTISEVAEELDLHKHVLRFWEVKFPQIKPMKRGGGRRYYRPADMELLRGIRHLLHADGYTIKGVQKILRERGVDAVKRVGTDAGPDAGSELSTAAIASSDRGEADAASDRQASSHPKAGAAGNTTKTARDVKVAPPSRHTAGNPDPGGRTGDVAKAIAELQACRDILTGAPPMKSADGSTAKSKRTMRAAG